MTDDRELKARVDDFVRRIKNNEFSEKEIDEYKSVFNKYVSSDAKADAKKVPTWVQMIADASDEKLCDLILVLGQHFPASLNSNAKCNE